MNKDREFVKFVLSIFYADFLKEQEQYIEKVVPFQKKNQDSMIESGIRFFPAKGYSYFDLKYHHSEDYKVLKEFEFEEIINIATTILKERIINNYKDDKKGLYLSLLRFPIFGLIIVLLGYFINSDFVAFYVSIILSSIFVFIWIAYSFYKFKSRVEWEQFYLKKELFLNSNFLEEINIEDEFFNLLNISKQLLPLQLKKKVIDWNKLIAEFRITYK